MFERYDAITYSMRWNRKVSMHGSQIADQMPFENKGQTSGKYTIIKML